MSFLTPISGIFSWKLRKCYIPYRTLNLNYIYLRASYDLLGAIIRNVFLKQACINSVIPYFSFSKTKNFSFYVLTWRQTRWLYIYVWVGTTVFPFVLCKYMYIYKYILVIFVTKRNLPWWAFLHSCFYIKLLFYFKLQKIIWLIL